VRLSADIANCVYYDNAGCILCDNGLMEGGDCPGNTTSIPNCLVPSIDLKVCLKCNDSSTWDVNTSSCVQLITNCSFYDKNGSCFCCRYTYTFINGECVPSTSPIPLCRCQVDNYCYACFLGFYLH